MKRTITALAVILLLSLSAFQAAAQQCASTKRDNGQPQSIVYRGVKDVYLQVGAQSLPLPTAMFDRFQEALALWGSCSKPNVPSYKLLPTPPGAATLPIVYINAVGPNGMAAAYATNPANPSQAELRLYQQCSQAAINRGFCDANGNVDWTNPYWGTVIAHELGHANGLGHDSYDPTCDATPGLMRGMDPTSFMRNGEYCDVADAQNCDPANPAGCPGKYGVFGTITGLGPAAENILISVSATVGGQTITELLGANNFNPRLASNPVFPSGATVTASLVSISNTNKTCTIAPQTFTMPGRAFDIQVACQCTSSNPIRGITTEDDWCPDESDLEDMLQDYIDERPPICEFCFDLEPWWLDLPGPFSPNQNCRTDCKVTGQKWVEITDPVTGQIIRLELVDEYTCTDVCTQSESVMLYGPAVSFSSPAQDATVSGRILVSGYANDAQGVKNLFFFVDKNEVFLEELQTGVDTPEACATANRPTPCNTNVGFRGWLDVNQFAQGQHHLEVLVSDADPQYPVPSLLRMPFTVGPPCADNVAPVVTITAPSSGAVLSRTVTVAASAADASPVGKAELYIDGVLKATDTVAPFLFVWDTTPYGNGPHVLTVRAYDACNNSGSSAALNVEVRNALDRRPEARNDQASTNIGTPVTIDVLANDTDPDGDAISLRIISRNASHGQAQISAGHIVYTPNANYSGEDSFQYEVQDARGQRDRAWVTVTVAGVNVKPTAVDDTASTKGTAGVTIAVTQNDSDPDGDIVRLLAAPITDQPDRGYATRLSNTQIVYTPYAPYTGTDRFQYEIADGKGHRARAWVTISLSEANRPPVAVNDNASTAANVPVTVNVTANDTDADGDQLLLVGSPIKRPPANGTAAKVSGTNITYTPNNGYTGTDSFEYEIGDGFALRSRATVTITVGSPNTAPVAVDDAAGTTAGVSVTINVVANDYDADGDHLTLIASPVTAPPANGTAVKISGTGITYTPRAGFSGADRFQYEIGDNRGLRSRAWVDVTVSPTSDQNSNPVASNDAASTTIGQPVTIVVTLNDTDPDGDTVTLIASPVTFAPQHGTAAKVSGTSIKYTPNAGFAGSDTFQYEVGDGRGKRSRAWVTVTVLDPNNRPIAVDDLATVGKNGVKDIVVTANDSDPDGDTVTLIASPVIVPPQLGTVTRKSGTTLTYRPNTGATGTDRFQYEIGDGHGHRARAWVNVTIFDVITAAAATVGNEPPVAIGDTVSIDQGTAADLDVLANDFDPEDHVLALTVAGITKPPLIGSAARTSERRLTYYAPAGFAGTDGFEYEISDGNGGTARAWVTVTVPVPNSGPEPLGEFVVTAVNREITIDIAANDRDDDNDPIRLTERMLDANPSHGSVRRVSDTQLAYNPDLGYVGYDTFRYEITDGRGLSATAVVTVDVTDKSKPPVAANDTFTVDSGVSKTVDVALNDSDPDGDVLSVVSSTQPAHGTLSWDAGTTIATYVSNAGYTGADSFTYTISDPRGLESSATVSVTVNPVRRAPVVQNDTASTPTLTAVLIGVLANDYDPEWTRLTVKSVTQPAKGTVVINRGESVIYTPPAAFSGTTTFTYVAADTSGMETTGTVTVTVLNAAPLLHSDSVAAQEDMAYPYDAFRFLGNDSDPDGHTLKIIAVTQPANGTLQYSADYTSFAYKGKANWAGIDGFYYTASDGFGGTAQAWVQVTVTAVNDAPVAVNDSFNMYKNQVLTLTPAQVLANDTDLENHTISLHSIGAATNGAASVLANGSIEYRPYGEFVGTDSFEYTIQDHVGGAYGSGRITVNVQQDTKPVANFVVTCTGRTCSFDASSSTDDRGIVTYQWTLGNNQAAAGKTFTYTYAAGGVYQVRLTVSDTLGQIAIVSKIAIVTEPPPDAKDDSFTWKKGYARYVSYASMLANDTDPANDALSIVSTDTALLDGTLTCDSTGCAFTPPSSYWMGQTSFKYTISDGHGQTDTATVYINFTY